MARRFTSAITSAAILISQGATPLAAQTRPAPIPEGPTTRPSPGMEQPVPLPQPVPDRPVPLPRPIPDGPQIQPPRPTYPGNPGYNDDYAGRISCESRNGRLQRCSANTENRVVLLTRSAGCTEGRTWGYDRNSIWVSGSCSGTFAYGYARGGVYPPDPGQSGGYAEKIRCESRNNRLERCNVRTENRVVLIDRHGGTCTEGRSWGYNRRSIWVSNSCRASFAYGYGSYWPDRDKDKGPSTGLIIGGVAVAAGLLALLASKNKKKDKAPTETTTPQPETPATYPPGPPAMVSADLSSLPADARPSMQTCLFEASRQIGVTGGTRVRFDRLAHIEPGNGGWRFRAELTSTYPDGDRATPMFCRATPTKVIELDFSS